MGQLVSQIRRLTDTLLLSALGKKVAPITATPGGVVFEFISKKTVSRFEKAELLRQEGLALFEDKKYEAAMSVLIDAGNCDPENAEVAMAYRNVREAVFAFQPQQSELPDGVEDDDDDVRHVLLASCSFEKSAWLINSSATTCCLLRTG